MPDISKLEKLPMRALHIFYVLDTSGSMKEAPIATLNRAMEETIEVLKKQAKSQADALLKVAVLEFNSGCKWMQAAGPEELEDFVWEDLSAGGLTDVGAALKALAEIRQNKWFHRATKIGFAIGDNPDMTMIADVVGNIEAVVKTDDLELFARLIKFASVTSTMLCSASVTTTQAVTGTDILKIAKQQEEAPDSITLKGPIKYDPEPAPVPDPDPDWGEDKDGDWICD